MIYIDTREKDTEIRGQLQALGIPFKLKKLNYGDYTMENSRIFIERKKTFDEILTNITRERDRFSREFLRARHDSCEIVLFIEQTYDDLKNHKYRSKMSPIVVEKMLKTWAMKYFVQLHLIEKKEATQFILDQLSYKEGGMKIE